MAPTDFSRFDSQHLVDRAHPLPTFMVLQTLAFPLWQSVRKALVLSARRLPWSESLSGKQGLSHQMHKTSPSWQVLNGNHKLPPESEGAHPCLVSYLGTPTVWSCLPLQEHSLLLAWPFLLKSCWNCVLSKQAAVLEMPAFLPGRHLAIYSHSPPTRPCLVLLSWLSFLFDLVSQWNSMPLHISVTLWKVLSVGTDHILSIFVFPTTSTVTVT